MSLLPCSAESNLTSNNSIIALGLSCDSSAYAEALAVQTQVLSVIVLPISVGQLGSDDADVPAVVHRKNKPDA